MNDNKWEISHIRGCVQVTFQAHQKGYHCTFAAPTHQFSRCADSYGTEFNYDFTGNDSLYIYGDYDSMVVVNNDIYLRAFGKTYLLKNCFNYAHFRCNIEGSFVNKNINGTWTREYTIDYPVTGAVITALGNNDSIYNKGNRVSIDAGSGKDTITNDGTNTTILAGMGDDEITNTASGVVMAAGNGYDTFTKKEFLDWLRDDLNDMFPADDAKITLLDGKGNDSLTSKGDNNEF